MYDVTDADIDDLDDDDDDLDDDDDGGDGDGIIGDLADVEHWHQQQYPDTCGVVAQEFILESVTGQDWSEETLRQESIAAGWYIPGVGNPPYAIGRLLEYHGVDVEQRDGASLDDLSAQLAEDHRVLVVLDAGEIYTPGQDPSQDDWWADPAGWHGQDSNHVVQVAGIDRSDPEHPVVILNDPVAPNGGRLRVPADEFVGAWADGGFFMVHTTGQVATNAGWPAFYQPTPCGAQYYEGMHGRVDRSDDGGWTWRTIN